MPHDLIAVGDVMLDGALPEPVAGGRVHGRIELRAGGSAANAALAAARLGARAAVVGRVGADAAGRLVADELAAAGVEPLLAHDVEARTGCVVVVGGTSIVADPGASLRLAPGDLPEALEAGAVLVSGYSLLQPGPEAAARAAPSQISRRVSLLNSSKESALRADRTPPRPQRADAPEAGDGRAPPARPCRGGAPPPRAQPRHQPPAARQNRGRPPPDPVRQSHP